MFFRFFNCVHSRCCYNKNSAKKQYKIFQHASPDKIYRSVSYRHELRAIFCKVQESKSPIKLTGVKRKLNYLDHTKEDIEINNTTKLQVIENASFPYLTSLDSILTIKEILDTKKIGKKVSLIVYLAAENRPVIQTRLK